MLHHILPEAALYLSPSGREFSLGLHGKVIPLNPKVVEVDNVTTST